MLWRQYCDVKISNLVFPCLHRVIETRLLTNHNAHFQNVILQIDFKVHDNILKYNILVYLR